MRYFLKIFFALVLFFNCALSHANSQTESRIFVFHINGVNTLPDDALKNVGELKKVAKIDSNIITWNILYNPTSGSLIDDLLDVYLQKVQEKKALDLDDYVEVYMRNHDLHYDKNSPEYEALKTSILENYRKDPSFFGNHFNTILENFKQEVPPEVTTRFQSVMTELKDYQKTKHAYVLLLPHSQGNLYANQLFSYLSEAEHFPVDHLAIFGIATPANFVPVSVSLPGKRYGQFDPTDNIRYVTSSNDAVINSMRLHNFFTFSEEEYPEPSNISFATLLCPDKYCHSLTDAYLHDETSKSLIAKQINLFIIALKDKLIREGAVPKGNIKFIFSTTGISYNPTRARLIDRETNKIICSNRECDNTLFAHIFSDFDESYGNLSVEYGGYSQHQYIGFTDKITSKNYLVTTDAPRYLGPIAFQLYGDIKSAVEWIQDCDFINPSYPSSLYLQDIKKITDTGYGAVLGDQDRFGYSCAVKIKEPLLPDDIIIANELVLN